VLWHQGESDAGQARAGFLADREITGKQYREFMEKVIRASRKRAGWEVPWFVAQATYHSEKDRWDDELRTAQKCLWEKGLALEGPDTDVLGKEYRAGVHFNARRLQAHGRLWAEKVGAYLDKVKFFLEFAVNDDQDAGHARHECIRGMEGVIRHVLAHNPKADSVLIYFVDPAMLKSIQGGKVPLTIASHDEVARHYAVSSVNLAEEVADRIRAGTLTWERYGGVHPGRLGNELCAALIGHLLTLAWKETLLADAVAEKHRLPDAPWTPTTTAPAGSSTRKRPHSKLVGTWRRRTERR
jgi:hypothetical protein